MKVIFLDIDGVLNHIGHEVFTPSGVYFVEDKKIELLKELVEATSAKIVLSSSWRRGWFDYENGINSTNSVDFCLLRDKLLEYGIEIVSRTPITEQGHRGHEIEMWLSLWKDEEVESILILDDCGNIYPFKDFFVKTFIEVGLTRKDVKRGIRILHNTETFREWKNRKEGDSRGSMEN